MTKKAECWVVDYGAAQARAIQWLGDRYLLAKPINRSPMGARRIADGALELHRQSTREELKAG
jgi:hypothetical protein